MNEEIMKDDLWKAHDKIDEERTARKAAEQTILNLHQELAMADARYKRDCCVGGAGQILLQMTEAKLKAAEGEVEQLKSQLNDANQQAYGLVTRCKTTEETIERLTKEKAEMWDTMKRDLKTLPESWNDTLPVIEERAKRFGMEEPR